MDIQIYSAMVKNPNTPETDMQPKVEHIVFYIENGVKKEAVVSATDPLNAMDIFRKMKGV